MDPANRPQQTLLELAQSLKAADRQQLSAMQPDVAQAHVDAVLVDLQWKPADPSQLAWPGDLGDSAELPNWLLEAELSDDEFDV